MARRLIRLRGLRPEVGIPVVYTGVRLGEKMHEDLLGDGEEGEPTSHPHIFRVRTNQRSMCNMQRSTLDELIALAEAQRNGEVVTRLRELVHSLILVNNLCEAILDICHKDLQGIYNVGGPQRISRYDFGRLVAQVYGFGEEHLNPIPQDEAGLTASRPRDCSLDTTKAQAALDAPLLDARAGLRRFKELEDTGYVPRLREGNMEGGRGKGENG